MKRKSIINETDDSSSSPKRTRRSYSSTTTNANRNNNSTESGTNRFSYGNFLIDKWPAQSRLDCFRREWFENRDVLDIGCNAGLMTLAVALVFRPASITGIDIDRNLINAAVQNFSRYQQRMQDEKTRRRRQSRTETDPIFRIDRTVFPPSMSHLYGPQAPPVTSQISMPSFTGFGFCRRVEFRCENYVLENDEDLRSVKEEFDTIMALNVTKWIHLTHSDSGLKRFFKRAYAELRPGGLFVLEPQSWASYKPQLKRKTANSSTYCGLYLNPERFKDYLLSNEVGFSACHVSSFDKDNSKGFCRPVLLFEKAKRLQP